MWVIIPSITAQDSKPKRFDVGWMDNDGCFTAIGEPTKYLGDAMDKVHYLNGGMSNSQFRELIGVLKLLRSIT